MANNRYYMKCPVCNGEQFIGKSLGNGIYNVRMFQGKWYKPEDVVSGHFEPVMQENDADAQVLNELYDWMWKHMMECHKDEFKGGELFKVVSEYPKNLLNETK